MMKMEDNAERSAFDLEQRTFVMIQKTVRMHLCRSEFLLKKGAAV